MPQTLQSFLAQAIPRACADLEAALARVPEDKRGWSAMGDARTALDMVAECAILNGDTSDMLVTRNFGDYDLAAYERAKNELAGRPEQLLDLLRENTERAAETVAALRTEDLDLTIEMPWGPMTLAQVASYPYWNMCYHEGQINFIASMLGCLK